MSEGKKYRATANRIDLTRSEFRRLQDEYVQDTLEYSDNFDFTFDRLTKELEVTEKREREAIADCVRLGSQLEGMTQERDRLKTRVADLQNETPEFDVAPMELEFHREQHASWMSQKDFAHWGARYAWSQAWAIANAKIKELEEKLEGTVKIIESRWSSGELRITGVESELIGKAMAQLGLNKEPDSAEKD